MEVFNIVHDKKVNVNKCNSYGMNKEEGTVLKPPPITLQYFWGSLCLLLESKYEPMVALEYGSAGDPPRVWEKPKVYSVSSFPFSLVLSR